MLKWTVYGKKNQEMQADGDSDSKIIDTNEFYNNLQSRKSLEPQPVRRCKKPSRYQRRSVGSYIRKPGTGEAEKENINYIGNTPNYYKEGFIKKTEGLALKEISNITPNSGTPNLERRRFYITDSNDVVQTELPGTPPTYSRRVREAKKRKLEMSNSNESFNRENSFYKSERKIQNVDRSNLNSLKLSHSASEPSLIGLHDRLSATSCNKNSFVILTSQAVRSNVVSTTKSNNEDLAEIEYDENLVLNCVEKPVTVTETYVVKSTLPIFGHHMFMDNPLYFNRNDVKFTSVRPLKRTRKKSNEFESSFKSPSIDRNNVHTLVRQGCSPAHITPLSVKLAALRFSTMSTHSKSKRATFVNNDTEYFPKVEHALNVPLRDEETSTEMENKFIIGRDSITNVTESTVSTTEMGDITLEKMIEDIIKSTKAVKSKRRIFQSEINSDHIPTIAEVKNLFVNPQTQNKANLIKEAKYINLSRENSVSPNNTPVKKKKPLHKVSDKLLNNLPIGCFMLEDGDDYNEREVITPEIETNNLINAESERIDPSLNRSRSMNVSTNDKSNFEYVSSESTPDLYSATKETTNLRLKRQKCIRRKKSTLSADISWKDKETDTRSFLTLEVGIPSSAAELQNLSELYEPLNNSFYYMHEPYNINIDNNVSLKSNISHSSSMPHDVQRPGEMFGLTLENGIPSPITPFTSLKRSRTTLSDERAHKTSKLEDLLTADAFTPIIEHKPSRRCLTYSPEEGSITSNEEKRQSVASNHLERSEDHFQSKGTIDLDIVTKNDVVDVHVIRCRDLQRPVGKADDINAYAKVVISGMPETQSLPSQRSIFQRTSVLYGKKEPEFQRHLRLPLPATIYEHQFLHISVWHRDKKYRRSEFLGCVSFPLKDAIKEDISGTYFLQQQSIKPGPSKTALDRVTEPRKMATDNIDTSTNEDTKENHNDKGVTANGPSGSSQAQAQAVAAALQREADEHLFLRYLELDPPDDPAAPRRAPRNGRTPFTTTRKLVRGAAGGFGFTVVWTRPPRIERVAAGGSAEKAGLRAGDYIVFVGTKNVVTASEEEVRNLVKSAGQFLVLETFRRIPQNGLGPRPRLAQVTIPPLPAESTPPPSRSPRGPASPAPAARPPTACSSTSQSLDRRKLHLPQVTFSKEVGNGIIV